jgi:hypothetical protein
MASSVEMNFFLEESTSELEAFVRTFINDTQAAPTFLRLIKEYAGNDRVGVVLNNILLKCEEQLGMHSFADGNALAFLDGRNRAQAGTIRGRSFRVWFHRVDPETWNNVTTAAIVFLLAATHPENGNRTITIAKLAPDQWSFETRRSCFIKALLICYQNNLCRSCDMLMVEPGTCAGCSLVVAAQPCGICDEEVGRMVKFKLVRGQPKVWCHQACIRRRADNRGV